MIPNDNQTPSDPRPVYVYPPANDYGQGLSPTVTKMDWLIWIILTAIPIVNLIMLIVYACDNTKPSRANLAKVTLILMAVGIIGCFLVFGCTALAAAGLAAAQ